MEYLVLVCLPQEHETGRVLHDTGFSYTLGYMKFLGSKISDMPELSAEHGGDQGHHQLADGEPDVVDGSAQHIVVHHYG